MKFTKTIKLITDPDRSLRSAHTTLYNTDPDTNLIIDLMRREGDKLGFIPITSLLTQIRKFNTLIWQKDQHGHKIGYLIHSHPRPNTPIHVHLTVIDIDKRRRKHATRAVYQLLRKAYESNAPEIRLRCAADLQANLFWQQLNFRLIATVPNMRKHQRDINIYQLTRDQFKTITHETLIAIPNIPYQ